MLTSAWISALLVAAVSGATAPVSLSVPIDPSLLLGWSLEFADIQTFVSYNASLVNPYFVQFVKNFKDLSGYSPVLRVGGTSQDASTWNPDPNFNETAGAYGRGYAQNCTIGPKPLYAMAEISKALGTPWIIGLKFGNPDNTTTALDIFDASVHILGQQLRNASSYNESVYVHQYGIFDRAIEQAKTKYASTRHRKVLEAGSFAGTRWNYSNLVSDGYWQDYGSSFLSFSQHQYFGSICTPSSTSGTLGEFMNHTVVKRALDGWAPTIRGVRNLGIQYLVGETNSASCHGLPGISDVFGINVWAVDYMLTMANYNVTGFNFHNGYNYTYNAITESPLYSGHWVAKPIYYAFMLTAEAIGGAGDASLTVSPLTSNHANLTGYAINADGKPSKLVLLNHFLYNASDTSVSRASQTLTASDKVPFKWVVSVKWLESATDAFEKHDISFGGQTLNDSPDGRVLGTPKVQRVKVSRGEFSLVIPPTSIALVTL